VLNVVFLNQRNTAMKKIILSVITFAAMVISTQAEGRNNGIQLNYGIEFNQFATGSGFKPGFEASAYIMEGQRRSLQLGVYFDSETKKVTGFSIQHKYVIIKNKKDRNFNVEPYLFYNFVYRSTELGSTLNVNTELASTLGAATYKSMEHHIGLGLKIKVLRTLFLHADAGFGRYLGSIMRPSAPDPITGMISGTNGWNMITKLGIGYNF
jgi:hypothetical protein